MKILTEKYIKNTTLESDAVSLKKHVKLEKKINANYAYEEGDTLVLFGSCIPPTNDMESFSELVCDLANIIQSILVKFETYMKKKCIF